MILAVNGAATVGVLSLPPPQATSVTAESKVKTAAAAMVFFIRIMSIFQAAMQHCKLLGIVGTAGDGFVTCWHEALATATHKRQVAS